MCKFMIICMLKYNVLKLIDNIKIKLNCLEVVVVMLKFSIFFYYSGFFLLLFRYMYII